MTTSEFMGFPIKTATTEQQRDAVMHGKFLHSGAGMAFYEYKGIVYVVTAGKPVSRGDGALVNK